MQKKKRVEPSRVGVISRKSESAAVAGTDDIAATVPIVPPVLIVPWAAAFLFLSILLAFLVWSPLAQVTFHYSSGANEGFSTYFARAVADGQPIYGKPPLYVYANYPPLWFHLTGYLSILTHDVNLTGRWVAVLMYVQIAVFMALIAQRLTDSRLCGAYAGFCWLVWLAALDPSRIGLNDPHMAGIAFGLAGLYCFVRDPESTRWLVMSAAVFAVSLFTKHTLLAFPAAVAIQLLATSRKRFAIWMGAAVAACLLLLLLVLAIDGRFFLQHLMLPRMFYAERLSYLGFHMLNFSVPLAAVLIWAFRTPFGTASVLVWGCAIAHVMGAVYAGGEGAGINHYFDAMIATGMIVGVAMPGIAKLVEGARFQRTFLFILLTVPFFINSLAFLPLRITSDLAGYPGLKQMESEFASATKFMSSQPGPALCEDLMLCYDAGKPFTYDSWAVDQLIRTGRLREADVLPLIDGRHFGTIELASMRMEASQPAERDRFSPAFRQQLQANYQLAYRTSKFVIFIPKAR